MRHTLGTPEEDDETVFEENDPMFWPYVYKSSDDGYVLIQTSSTESCETWILDADDPQGAFSVVEPRAPGHEYSVEALGDTLYILTNLGAKNFRVMSAPVVEPSGQHWTEVVPARDDVLIESIEAFPGFVAMLVKSGGFSELRTVNLASGSESVAAGGDEPSSIWFESNRRPSDRLVRYGYCSFTTPVQTRSLDLSTGISSVLKQDSVGGGFDGSRYSSTVMYAPSHDGVEVPISMVWRSDMGDPVDRPLLLEGYGAYGYSSDPWFSSSMLSLLDRGFVFAIAHVRGGSEMGREWYEDGRLMNKRNTFLDFIACAEYLVNTGVTSRDRMFARGGSAGGLLVGAVTNMSPGLFRGVIANVPFVDVVTTMLDPGIPLTTNEYEEWGDPSVPAFYEYMLSYSPYDNVAAADYPAMFVTAGWNDSQVCYWEPSKWVARIRRLRTDDDPVVFRIDMGAGHAGESGRFGWLKNAATEQAFLIGLLRSEAALRYSIP
jgi:oligopeptidase B